MATYDLEPNGKFGKIKNTNQEIQDKESFDWGWWRTFKCKPHGEKRCIRCKPADVAPPDAVMIDGQEHVPVDAPTNTGKIPGDVAAEFSFDQKVNELSKANLREASDFDVSAQSPIAGMTYEDALRYLKVTLKTGVQDELHLLFNSLDKHEVSLNLWLAIDTAAQNLRVAQENLERAFEECERKRWTDFYG